MPEKVTPRPRPRLPAPPPEKCFAFTEDLLLLRPSSDFETSFNHFSAATSEVANASLSSPLHSAPKTTEKRLREFGRVSREISGPMQECSEGAPRLWPPPPPKIESERASSAAFAAGESVMSGRRGILSCAGLQGGPTGLTPEMEEFHMMFDKNRKRSIKQHIKYFNFRS